MLLKFVQDLAYDPEVLKAYRRDPEATLARYQDLTEYERSLVRSGRSAVVETYLRDGPDSQTVYAAAPVIIASQVVVIIIGVHDEGESSHAAETAYWDRVVGRAGQLSA